MSLSPEVRAGLPILGFDTAADFAAFLAAQPAGSKGLWLKLAKQGAGVPCVGKAAAIEVALCHGWIDGQLNAYSAHFWLIRFTRRQPRSKWSETNCRTATRLIEEGRMQPAGMAQVEAAQKDGRWDAAYPAQSEATVSPDFQAALDARPAAAAFFASLRGANRFAVLYRVHEVRHEPARARRIEKLVAMLERQEVFHPPTAKSRPKAKP